LVETTERVVGFCGIARPEEFFSALTAAGVNLELTVTFGDHHSYTREDVQRLAKVAEEVRADSFVTTEKDAVKLDAGLRAVLEGTAPMRVARLTVSLQDEASAVRQLLERLPAR
jgi:tetraacyldisaccharide 4'-kinase